MKKVFILLTFFTMGVQLVGHGQQANTLLDEYKNEISQPPKKARFKKLISFFFHRNKTANTLPYDLEVSPLKKKLLNHQVSVPRFFSSTKSANAIELSEYLRWIHFEAWESKTLFPDIMFRPYTSGSKLFYENFIKLGVNLPI